MNVLMIEHFLPGNTYSLELSRNLGSLLDLTLLCSTKMPSGYYNFNCINKFYTGGKEKVPAMFSYLKSLSCLYHELKRKYDIVHIQTMKSMTFEMPIYMYMKSNIGPIVYTVHNVLSHEYVHGEEKKLKKFYNACDALLVHNIYSGKLLNMKFDVPEERIHVIPMGIFSNSVIESEYHKKDVMTFLFFGAIRKYKGLDILFEAISKIPQMTREKMRFIIAGEQMIDTTDYESMIRTFKIEDVVQFYNFRIPYDKLPELFDKADVCVLPYREIYGSAALLMAYSFCKPVIVSDVPTFVEETEDGSTGLLFRNEDSDSLARTICQFTNLSVDHVNKFKDNIKKLALEKYNWELSAVKTYEVYKSLLK